MKENFLDGRNPQDKGDSQRHGIPKKATLAQLKKIRSSNTASPRSKQLAHWQINMRSGKRKVDESLSVLSQWKNDDPVSYIKQLSKFFGMPDELTHKRAIWYNKDGFKRIEVLDEYILHASPVPHYDYVYSYVDLKVSHELADDLANSSESILIDYLKGEVGARCASLSANAVTIQYVIDVVEGNVKPSKQEYEKRIKSMKKMFTDGKRFELDWWPDVTGDTDPKNAYYAESANRVWGCSCAACAITEESPATSIGNASIEQIPMTDRRYDPKKPPVLLKRFRKYIEKK